MSYIDGFKKEVRKLVWRALDLCEDQSPAVLAKRLGVSCRTVMRWRDAYAEPSASDYLLICEFIKRTGGR